ncbi:MAG TPA: hypothetical protein VLH09_10240 [Bryobacteraceae bacterium]|nr:hypothetical protein [Bryobacteraceae bacterium]
MNKYSTVSDGRGSPLSPGGLTEEIGTASHLIDYKRLTVEMGLFGKTLSSGLATWGAKEQPNPHYSPELGC